MPAVSQKQRAWSWTQAGKEALGKSAKDFQHTHGKLPERVKKSKPIRSHTHGKKNRDG